MNLDRFERDLDSLIKKGELLNTAIQHECFALKGAHAVEKSLGDGAEQFIQALPSFREDYQPWYSEAKALVRQLLPDRLSDFTRYYEKPKSRKEITSENYTIEDYLEITSENNTIEDYLQGLRITFGSSKEVGPDAAIPRFSPAAEHREGDKRTLP